MIHITESRREKGRNRESSRYGCLREVPVMDREGEFSKSTKLDVGILNWFE